MRYFIEIAYDGSKYFGWQMQPDALSVQQVLEKAMSTVLRKEIKVVGAGRTDAGVHAKQLFAHFDHEKFDDPIQTIFRLNSFLPKDISVKNLIPVVEDGHARFSAIEREYEYVISLIKDPFTIDHAYYLYRRPNLDLMIEATKNLFDYQDFQCFSRSNTDVKTYNCKIKKAFWIEEDDKLVFTIAADRFLRNMVRAIVGTLLDVGFEKTSLEEFHTILKSKSREEAGASAPGNGLFLTKITYPEEIFLKDH